MPHLDPVTGDYVDDVLTFIDPTLLRQKCLDHGFVNIIDVMPRLVPVDNLACDFALADAARLSYQKGTRKISTDTGLIDNLIRNRHTSPIEMGELKFHVRMPIFVMRQHVRHRTFSMNEESARYSQLAGDFYIPEPQHWAINTSADKQATQQGKFTLEQAEQLQALVASHNERSYALYEAMLHDADTNDAIFHPRTGDDGTEDFDAFLTEIANTVPGLGREQARMILGVNIYTSAMWKGDLKNLLHYISLRWDKHAQYEIRVFGEAFKNVVQALFPAAWRSFEDNFIDGVNFSKTELALVKIMTVEFGEKPQALEDATQLVITYGWTKRRLEEFTLKAYKSGLVSNLNCVELLRRRGSSKV
jgi:thymidylate synthase (FAD)